MLLWHQAPVPFELVSDFAPRRKEDRSGGGQRTHDAVEKSYLLIFCQTLIYFFSGNYVADALDREAVVLKNDSSDVLVVASFPASVGSSVRCPRMFFFRISFNCFSGSVTARSCPPSDGRHSISGSFIDQDSLQLQPYTVLLMFAMLPLLIHSIQDMLQHGHTRLRSERTVGVGSIPRRHFAKKRG